MNNYTLTNINKLFWNNINYYFYCFKKNDDNNIIKIQLNDYEDHEDHEDLDPETNILLGVASFKMTR